MGLKLLVEHEGHEVSALKSVEKLLESNPISFDDFAKIHVLSYKLEVTAPKDKMKAVGAPHDASEDNN